MAGKTLQGNFEWLWVQIKQEFKNFFFVIFINFENIIRLQQREIIRLHIYTYYIIRLQQRETKYNPSEKKNIKYTQKRKDKVLTQKHW